MRKHPELLPGMPLGLVSSKQVARGGLVDNQHLSFTKGQFTVTTDPAFFQLEAIHDYLSRSSWAPGIDAETVRISIQNSLCFALLDRTKQIGFARLVTDYATFAYLCDVYVLNDYQKSGLGRWLIECCHAHPLMSRLRRIIQVGTDPQRDIIMKRSTCVS